LIAIALATVVAACEPAPTMALPLTREETATPANPVSSNTINAIQDAIIGGKHGAITKRFGPTSIVAATPDTATPVYNQAYVLNGAIDANFWVSLDLPIGAVITEVRVRLDPAGAHVLRAQLYRFTHSTLTDDALDFADSTTGLWETIAITPGAPYPTTDDQQWSVRIFLQSGAGGGDQIAYVDVDYYVP
jgi:hypothetical protein